MYVRQKEEKRKKCAVYYFGVSTSYSEENTEEGLKSFTE